jgi:hypothetical protein
MSFDSDYYAVVVFRRPTRVSDKFLSLFAGELVHCDIIPLDVSDEQNAITFTSYVGETFSMSINTKKSYDNNRNVALAIPYSKEEFGLLTTYLFQLYSNNVPYNYSDILLDTLPCRLREVVVDDVSSEDPAQLSTVYCSQAVVLALRNSLHAERNVLETLRGVNSRVTIPLQLYHLLRPFSHHVDCTALRKGQLFSYSPSNPV